MPNVWATLRQCRLRPATACVCWRISASSRLAHSGCRPSSLACSAHHLNTHLDPQCRGSAPGLVDIDLGDPSTQHCPGTRPQDALTPHTAHRTPTRKHGSTWTGFAAGYRDRVVSDPRSPFRGPRNQSQPGSKSTGPPTRNSEEPYFLSDTACAVLGSRHVSVPALVGARTFMRLRWRRASGAHHSRPEFVAQSVNCEFGISAAVFRLTKK